MNNNITMEIEAPNEANSYQGVRFSRAGIIRSLTWKGLEIFGQWRNESVSSDFHDAVAGTAGEFGMGGIIPSPLNYEEAAVGEGFIKIGVGVLIKKDEEPYKFYDSYQILQNGTWDCEIFDKSVSMSQSLKYGSYGYKYQHTIQLEDDGFTLHHKLTNIGKSVIRQTHYSHNFFTFEKVGKELELELPFTPEIEQTDDTIFEQKNNSISFTDWPVGESAQFTAITGFNTNQCFKQMILRNKRMEIKVTGDRAISNFHLFATPKTICPEPFVMINIKDNETFTWSFRYEFNPT